MIEVPAGASSLIGRERDLVDLRAAVDEAVAGRGRLVLLSGEPGIGKTRTAQELAAHATSMGISVLWGSCWEGSGAPAYWPWIQVIRAYLRGRSAEVLLDELGPAAADIAGIVPEIGVRAADPGSGSSLEPEQVRFRLFDGITSFLKEASKKQAIVVIVDDLHWADASSLLLLQFLASQIADAALLVVGTYRDVEVGRDHPLTRALGELGASSTLLILPGLDEPAVKTLIAVVAGREPEGSLAATIHRQTGGNPFFVREIVRLMAAQGRFDAERRSDVPPVSMPGSVREVVERRLARLSSETAETLAAASAIGVEFGLDLLEAATGRDRLRLIEALDEAIASRIATPFPDGLAKYRFAHALMRETLYESLPSGRRLALHLQIGGALEALPDADSRLAELAHHFFQAAAGGGAEKAILYARRAGDRAISQLAADDAATHFERALEIQTATGGDEAERSEILLSLGDALWRSGRMAEMKDAFQRAADLARRIEAAEMLGRAALGYAGASVQGFSIRTDELLVDLLEEALDALGDADSELRVRLLGRLAVEVYWSDDERKARFSRSALESARRLGDPAVELVATYAAHWALLSPDTLEEELAATDDILRLAMKVGDREMIYLGHQFRVTSLMQLDDIHAVDNEIAACARLAEELRLPIYRWQVQTFRTMRTIVDGRLGEAESIANEGLGILRPGPSEVAAASWGAQMFIVRWLQGRLIELEPAIKSFAAQYPWIPSYGAVLSLLYCELDRHDEARSQFVHLARNDFGVFPRDAGWLSAMWGLALACSALGDARRAAVLYDLLSPYSERTVTAAYFLSLGAVQSPLGVLARTMHRYDEAIGHLRQAQEREARTGNRPFLALALREEAAARIERDAPGDAEEAAAALDRAFGLIDMLGLEGLRPRAVALRERLPASQAAAERARPPTDQGNVFRLEGDGWRISYEDTIVVLKDSKGLQDIARLLARPGREVHVSDLMSASEGINAEAGADAYRRMTAEQLAREGLAVAAGSGHESLDARARESYRRRIDELQDEIDEGEATSDVERAGRAKEERDLIADQLARAYGLGNRARRSGDPVERARKAVTWRIRKALTSIDHAHPSLGHHLDRSIRTGTFCVYEPDPHTRWSV